MVIRFDYKHFKVLVTNNDEKCFPKTKKFLKEDFLLKRFFTKTLKYRSFL